jgi:hypothetical protein
VDAEREVDVEVLDATRCSIGRAVHPVARSASSLGTGTLVGRDPTAVAADGNEPRHEVSASRRRG